MDRPDYDPETEIETDLKTIRNMIAYGGSFVIALGNAASRADADNLRRLKVAFPEYWAKYSSMATR